MFAGSTCLLKWYLLIFGRLGVEIPSIKADNVNMFANSYGFAQPADFNMYVKLCLWPPNECRFNFHSLFFSSVFAPDGKYMVL